MDFAVRNNIYAYNPGACITRCLNPSKHDCSVRVNYSGNDEDVADFSNTKNVEENNADVKQTEDIDTGVDIGTKILIDKASKAADEAQTEKEFAGDIIYDKQELAKKVIKYKQENGEKMSNIFWISSGYNTDLNKTSYKISKDDNQNTDNATEVRFEKVRSTYWGKEEKDDLITKKTEIKTSNELNIVDCIQNGVANKNNESEYLKYSSRLSCNYDGRPEFYAKGYEYDPMSGIEHWDEYLDFDGKTGQPKHFYTDMNLSSAGRDYSRHLEFRNGQWKEAT